MINPADIIHLSKQAFWNVDMEKLDYEKNADYIIAKVFDNGSMEDIMEITAWYGDDKVAKALMDAPYLKEITLVLASKFFNIPISSFKCSTTKQYHPIS
ncbi:MAG: hypothetical protein ABI267_04910 [Ginsengibacter sp.]